MTKISPEQYAHDDIGLYRTMLSLRERSKILYGPVCLKSCAEEPWNPWIFNKALFTYGPGASTLELYPLSSLYHQSHMIAGILDKDSFK